MQERIESHIIVTNTIDLKRVTLMKKAQYFTIVLILFTALSLSGCGKLGLGKDKIENGKDNVSQGDNQDKIIIDPNSFAIVVDPKLTGMELIKKAQMVNPPEAISYNTKSIMGSGEEAYESTGRVLQAKGNYRLEMESQDMPTEVTIYNANEKMTYKYVQSEKKGYKYGDNNSGEGPSFEGEYDLALSFIDEEKLVKAQVVNFEGQAAIYYEMKDGQSKVEAWISLKYGIVFKMITYDNDKMVAQTINNNISLPASIELDNFIPPADIEFDDPSVAKEDTTQEPSQEVTEIENIENQDIQEEIAQ